MLTHNDTEIRDHFTGASARLERDGGVVHAFDHGVTLPPFLRKMIDTDTLDEHAHYYLAAIENTAPARRHRSSAANP